MLIQLSPISPGSITRGVFVLYLMIKERDVKNYYIAAPIAFIHVIGYLAFPMQMVAHNAALARFMAGRWARSLTHVVPVFGESGGLLEHGVFDLFFNVPLSLLRGFRVRPIVWAMRSAVLAAIVGLVLFLSYARIWEWRQPEVALQGVRVASIVPYYASGGDLHWRIDGTRIYLDSPDVDADVPVDFPADAWDERVAAHDTVDVVVRRSFFGEEYDGLRIAPRPADGAAAEP